MTPRPSVLQDFDNTLKECTLLVHCGREVVLVERLAGWLREKNPETQADRVTQLLRAVYPDGAFPPLRSDDICHGQDCCILVFCILLNLGHGCRIDEFRRKSIVDRHLPVALPALQNDLRGLEDVANNFFQRQWRFCPARFDLRMGKSFQPSHVIPVHKKGLINSKGGTASLWQIAVYEEFVSQRLREALPKSRGRDSRFGHFYECALKTFSGDDHGKEMFENEKNAFNNLQNHEGMVRYLGAYDHEEPSGDLKEETHNILLEYGEYDLDEYFAAIQPPVLPDGIEKFWTELFEIAKAVKGIHFSRGLTYTGTTGEEWHGWHADVKPDNILQVQGRFKLADPGFAMFRRRTPQEEIPQEFINGGTETYGAPEHFRAHLSRKTTTPVSQAIDIWSLGCVFSVAATWMVLGGRGIPQFTKLRQNATTQASEQQSIRTSTPDRTSYSTRRGRSDSFHNGHRVLRDVLVWHKMLRSACRRNDLITCGVLDLVEDRMLLEDPNGRIRADGLCIALESILKRASEERDTRQPQDDILGVLFEDETEQVKRAVDSQERKRKSERLGGSMNRAPTDGTSALTIPETDLCQPDAQPDGPLTPQGTSVPMCLPQETSQLSAQDGSLSPSAPFSPRSSSRRIITSHSSRIFEYIKGKVWHRSEIDRMLARHFEWRRDIVFLVDNAETMEPHWGRVAALLSTLVSKLEGQDEDGMELYFTSGSVSVNSKKGKDFRSAMGNPNAKPMEGVHTDIRKPLGVIFQRYSDRLRLRPAAKLLALYVFTDGVWAGMTNELALKGLDGQIVDFVKLVMEHKRFESRSVGIQFIQFGSDAKATRRLRHLDDGLKGKKGIPDVIDTAPANSSIEKIILGSFVEEFDEHVESERSSSGTSRTTKSDIHPPNQIQSAMSTQSRGTFTDLRPIADIGLTESPTSSTTMPQLPSRPA